MVRSYWIGPLFGALALTGLAQGQTTPAAHAVKASDSKERFVTVGDLGKPGQKCRVLKTWTMPNGNPAYQVQALDTGELMTIEESSAPSAGPGARPKVMHVFAWGRETQTSPHGSPTPPPNAVVLARPFDVHSKPVVPPSIAAVPEKPRTTWPPAFVVKRPGEDKPVVAEKRLTPVAIPVTKAIEKTRPSTPDVAKPAPVATVAAVGAEKSPYYPKRPDGQPSTAKSADGKVVPSVGSPYNQADAKPVKSEPSHSLAPTKPSESPVVKTQPAAAPKVATTPAQPGDWRQSWGKIPPAKSAAAGFEEKTTTQAAKKTDLPHAVVKTDDPLRTPEKFVAAPRSGAFDGPALADTKKPLLGVFNSSPAPFAADKKHPSLAPVPAALATAAPTVTKPELVVKVAPPAPAQLKPASAPKATPAVPAETSPAITKATPTSTQPPRPALPAKAAPPVSAQLTPLASAETAAPAPVELPPLASTRVARPALVEVKPTAKPVVPLGMQSVIAARAPELAPTTPQKPAPASQALAMGIDAGAPNAFTEVPAGQKAAVASRGFSLPKMIAAPQPDGAAGRPLSAPPVLQAAYHQESSQELGQLWVVMHESVYPSQREWAAERLASFDWRQQPQALELLMDRAKNDPAPLVRAECVRSLTRMKCDAPAVVDAVKSFQSDADSRVRQAANNE